MREERINFAGETIGWRANVELGDAIRNGRLLVNFPNKVMPLAGDEMQISDAKIEQPCFDHLNQGLLREKRAMGISEGGSGVIEIDVLDIEVDKHRFPILERSCNFASVIKKSIEFGGRVTVEDRRILRVEPAQIQAGRLLEVITAEVFHDALAHG